MAGCSSAFRMCPHVSAVFIFVLNFAVVFQYCSYIAWWEGGGTRWLINDKFTRTLKEVAVA